MAQTLGGPAQVGFEHLTDVHAGRHAQRVEHDVHRTAIGVVGHVLDRDDGGNHALVAMTAGHLVARLDAALHGKVDLDHLHHARSEVIALRDLGLLVLVAALELAVLVLQAVGHDFQLRIRVFVLQTNFEPLLTRQVIEVGRVDGRASLQLARAAVRHLASQQAAYAREQIVLEDALLVVQVLADPLQFGLLDGLCTAVLLDAVTREHANVDDGTVHARRHAL